MACWRLRLSKFDVVLVSSTTFTKQIANSLFSMKALGVKQTPIEDNSREFVIETRTVSTPNTRLKAYVATPTDEAEKQTVAKVVDDIKAVRERAAPIIVRVLRHQVAATFCKQCEKNTGQANAALIIDRNKLIVRRTSVDAAIQVVVPHAH